MFCIFSESQETIYFFLGDGFSKYLTLMPVRPHIFHWDPPPTGSSSIEICVSFAATPTPAGLGKG
jgi:hypothetical protein